MEKTFRITIEGKVYVVKVEDITAGEEQRLYPEPGSMKVQPTDPARQPDTGRAAGAAQPEAPGEPGDELSPLAGLVQTVHVAEGQTVTEGDKLVAIEAMKMVTEVVAKRTGTVGDVAVSPGDPVEAGQRLLRIT